MSSSARDGMEQTASGHHNLPSIPILQCRWGLGEGVSPTVFKPLRIPQHLLRSEADPPGEPTRRLQGRGRAAGLSCHTDPMPIPGDLANVGVSNLTIQEQINRVRGDLPIYEPPTDYSQYILPRRASQEDEDSVEQEPPSAPTPPRPVLSCVSAAPSRRSGWADALDPFGEVAAVESSMLPQNMSGGGGDAGVKPLGRYTQSFGLGDDSDDLDVLEERTSSSDTSDGWSRRRTWRPRPPPLNEQSFPSLPDSAAAPPDRSPSKSGRSSSSQRSTAAGGDGPEAQRKKRGARRSRKKPAADESPAVDPSVTSSVTSATGQASGTPSTAEDKSTGRVYVTGVTDDNWEKVRSYVAQYGHVEDSERGPHGDAWFILSPAENAEWVVSVHASTECDIPGVAFQLADDGAGHH